MNPNIRPLLNGVKKISLSHNDTEIQLFTVKIIQQRWPDKTAGQVRALRAEALFCLDFLFASHNPRSIGTAYRRIKAK